MESSPSCVSGKILTAKRIANAEKEGHTAEVRAVSGVSGVLDFGIERQGFGQEVIDASRCTPCHRIRNLLVVNVHTDTGSHIGLDSANTPRAVFQIYGENGDR